MPQMQTATVTERSRQTARAPAITRGLGRERPDGPEKIAKSLCSALTARATSPPAARTTAALTLRPATGSALSTSFRGGTSAKTGSEAQRQEDSRALPLSTIYSLVPDSRLAHPLSSRLFGFGQGGYSPHPHFASPLFSLFFDLRTEASPESWNHYAVQVKRISEDASGDPDLFILLAGVQEIPDGTVPSTTGANFTLADASAGSIVAASIRRDDYHPRASSERQGAYVCVHAYQGGGAVKVAVHVHRDSCPVRFGRGDAALVCSTPVDESDPGKRRFDGCSDEGTCQCVEPWSKPVPDVYSGAWRRDSMRKVDRTGVNVTAG